MGRIRDAVATGARAVRRVPIPSALTHQALREARRSRPPSSVQKAHAVENEMIGRTRCVWLDGHHADQGVIVHLHGGAYVSGPFAHDWTWLSRQSAARGCAGLMIDYRAAPDHQHPVALDDADAVLTSLAQQERLAGRPWVLSGQHSGGGLALSLARRILENPAIPDPSAIVVMSPWLDLELSNARITEAGRVDPVHERRLLRDAARRYAGGTSLDDPELSPINASLKGIAPVHLSVGLRDLFLPDVRVARLQFEEDGLDLSYREVSGRLALQLVQRRGEDVTRLYSEQSAVIAKAFSSPR